MTTNYTSARGSESDARERMLSTLAGVLGILMFLAGFMRWLSVGEGDDQSKFSGFAFQMPTTAVIGLSLAAGLIALLGAMDRRQGRGVPSAIPTGLALTSLLLAIGIYLGKGAISPELGDEVGVEPGLLVGIVIAAIQSVLLGMGLASRHDNDHTEGRTETTRIR